MKWVAGTLVLLIAGLWLELGLLVYAMYVLLGILFLSRFCTRAWMRDLHVSRSNTEAVAEIGDTLEISVAVENRGKLSVPWLIIEDSLSREALVDMPPQLRAAGARVKLTRLGPGKSEVLNYTLTLLKRGYYQLGPLWLETGDVFGLHRQFQIAAEPLFVSVLPKVLPLLGYNLASRRPMGEIRVAHRLFEDPTRLAGLRPYQRGDPLNRIHWRATARTGELHSRVYETSRVAGATFVLDFSEQSHPVQSGGASAELAVKAVASLANAVYLMGEQIGLVSNGRDGADRIREEGWRGQFTTRGEARKHAGQTRTETRFRPVIVPTGKGADQFRRLLETLARLEVNPGLSFAGLLNEAAPEIRRDATVVPVLKAVTPEIAIALGQLARRGFIVTALVVSIEESLIPDWARPPDWAGMLLAQGVDFRIINSEECISQLCAEAIVR
jgi:uncharacterized protein (DUF58 family)